jgi:hypothetical protein
MKSVFLNEKNNLSNLKNNLIPKNYVASENKIDLDKAKIVGIRNPDGVKNKYEIMTSNINNYKNLNKLFDGEKRRNTIRYQYSDTKNKITNLQKFTIEKNPKISSTFLNHNLLTKNPEIIKEKFNSIKNSLVRSKTSNIISSTLSPKLIYSNKEDLNKTNLITKTLTSIPIQKSSIFKSIIKPVKNEDNHINYNKSSYYNNPSHFNNKEAIYEFYNKKYNPYYLLENKDNGVYSNSFSRLYQRENKNDSEKFLDTFIRKSQNRLSPYNSFIDSQKIKKSKYMIN